MRSADARDLDRLNALMQDSEAYRGDYASILEGYSLTAEQIARDRCIVAEDDTGIVGFYALCLEPQPELDLMFVADATQGRGIGALLIGHLRNLAASLGVTSVRIVSHPPAEAFYRRIGARRIGMCAPSGKVRWERPILSLPISAQAGTIGAMATSATDIEPVHVLETERMILRRLDSRDAAFIFELVNDADWLRYIGDKGVRTLDDAHAYIRNGPLAMYERFGFGLYCVESKADGAPMGLCGLLKRDTLDDVDIGFAFLPAYRAKGYAREAATATLDYARDTLKLGRVIAIVSPDNRDSTRLLERIGLRFEGAQRHGDDAHEVNVFGIAIG